MKAELVKITEAMTGNTELAETLMKNFNAINDMAATREDAIFKRLGEINTSLSRQIDGWGQKLDKKLNFIDKNLTAINKKLNIDPDLLTED
jgi:hypothetical protein